MTSSHPTPAPCQWFSWLAAALARRSAPRLPQDPRPRPADRHDLDQGGQARRPLSAMLRLRRHRRRRWKAGRPHRRTPADRGGTAATQGCHAADPRPGRHPDGAVMASSAGGLRSSPPPARPALPTSMAMSSLSRRCWSTTRPGARAACAAGPAQCPQERPAEHRSETPAIVPNQAGTRRRATPMGQAVARAADLGGDRRCLCHEELPQAGHVVGNDGRQPAPQGCGPAILARPPAGGQTGRPRTYGPDVIDLTKRAGQRRGWSTDTFTLYGVAVVKKYKTILPTWRPAGGVIRVVWWTSRPAGGPTSAPTHRRAGPTSWERLPIASA